MTARRALDWTRALGRTTRDRFPLNASGLALLALTGVAGWFYGVGRLDLILLTAAFCGAVLTVALACVTPLAAVLVHRRLTRSASAPLRLLCGEWSPTGLRLRAPRWLPFLAADVTWVTPPSASVSLEGGGGAEMVFPRRRGVYPELVRRVTVGDILGLTSVRWTVHSPVPVTLEPGTAPLERPADLAGLVGGEELPDPSGAPAGDRVDIRRYGPGDSPRLILWKVYARTRRLFVRTPERALEAAPRTCAYLISDPGDEPAATLARTVLERNLLGEGWRFGADGADDAERLEGALFALARSGTVPPTACSLDLFLQRAAKQGFGACLLFLPPGPGPWLDHVLSAVAGTPLRVHAVASFRGWAGESIPEPFWQRLVLKPAVPVGAELEQMAALAEAFAATPARFSLADTESGAILRDPGAYLARAGKGKVA
jgi:hypothetical protein